MSVSLNVIKSLKWLRRFARDLLLLKQPSTSRPVERKKTTKDRHFFLLDINLSPISYQNAYNSVEAVAPSRSTPTLYIWW